jgi:glutathione synthase/RimK-type ligase-like ATP-grasp enzyme
MKLILANNQTERFVDFYKSLQAKVKQPFDYSGYSDLLFVFDSTAEKPVNITNLATGKNLDEYSGVYINGYLDTYELAAATAVVCQSLNIPFVNRELEDPPSLSKLSMYAKLTSKSVSLPYSIAGTQAALVKAERHVKDCNYPAVLKRADADQGIDNYMVNSSQEMFDLVSDKEPKSIWILQEFIANDGFYLISFYGQKPAFCIHRTLEERPDGNKSKAHMYKPKGGANASLIELADVPRDLLQESQKAVEAMNRQIASVDCLYDPRTSQAYVLEVNYNPQLVTIETLKTVRVKALLGYLNEEW